MEIRVLRYFLAVVREESITKAADLLHITQPTLSRQIAQLEEEMGIKLFDRGTRKIVLTEEGLLLRRRAEEILELVDKTERELAKQDEKVAGTVSVGCGDLAAVQMLPELFEAFHRRYPAVTFDLYTATADHIKDRMDRGLTDVGLLLEPVHMEKYDYIRLYQQEQWVVIMHHALNWRWYKNLAGGKYGPLRILQTAVDFLALFSMLGLMVSGVILSREVFAFLPIAGGTGFARILHMLCSYWGFILMSVHLGLHWGMLLGVARRVSGRIKPSAIRAWVLRALALALCAAGLYAFWKHGIADYLFLRTQFVFFDMEQPLALFLGEYLAIMGLWACIAYYGAGLLRKAGGGKACVRPFRLWKKARGQDWHKQREGGRFIAALQPVDKVDKL